jgi:hypothetical protein
VAKRANAYPFRLLPRREFATGCVRRLPADPVGDVDMVLFGVGVIDQRQFRTPRPP